MGWVPLVLGISIYGIYQQIICLENLNTQMALLDKKITNLEEKFNLLEENLGTDKKQHDEEINDLDLKMEHKNSEMALLEEKITNLEGKFNLLEEIIRTDRKQYTDAINTL